MKNCPQQQITQHKRFVPYGTHPNFYLAKTSFMLGTLAKMALTQKPIGGKKHETWRR
jgi:hypothetical protein